ncbi:MAG: hypothetical protein WAM27_05465 [Nitrososphaeraceae archaeon]
MQDKWRGSIIVSKALTTRRYLTIPSAKLTPMKQMHLGQHAYIQIASSYSVANAM